MKCDAPHPAKKPTILQVLPAMDTGGVQRGTVEIAEAIVKAGWRSIVVSSGGPLAIRLEQVGAEHITLPIHKKTPWGIRKSARLLQEVIERHGVDLVHARSRAPAWAGWKACQKTGTKFVTTFHSTYGHAFGLKRWYNSVMTRGARIIAISEHIRRHIEVMYGIPHQDIDLIYRAVNTKNFDPEAVHPSRMVPMAEKWRLPEDKLTFLMPGRITKSKGHALLFDALKKIEDNPDWFCGVIGPIREDSKIYKSLVTQIKSLGLENRIRFLGASQDMPACLMLADVVISASTQPEGFGRTVAESCAMGRITVAPDFGGTAEIIVPNKTGYTFEAGNADALAEALKKTLNLKIPGRKKIAAAAHEHVVDNFSVEIMQKKTLDVYKRVLGL